MEVGFRLEDHDESFGLGVAWNFVFPVAAELLFVKGVLSFAGVCDMEAGAVARDVVEHYEMVLVPMQDAGLVELSELGEGNAGAYGVEADLPGGVGDTFHGYAFGRGGAECVEVGHAYLLAVGTADHGEAGDATLHRVALPDCADAFPTADKSHLISRFF